MFIKVRLGLFFASRMLTVLTRYDKVAVCAAVYGLPYDDLTEL